MHPRRLEHEIPKQVPALPCPSTAQVLPSNDSGNRCVANITVPNCCVIRHMLNRRTRGHLQHVRRVNGLALGKALSRTRCVEQSGLSRPVQGCRCPHRPDTALAAPRQCRRPSCPGCPGGAGYSGICQPLPTMCRSEPHSDAISVFTTASVSKRFRIRSIGDKSNVVNTE